MEILLSVLLMLTGTALIVTSVVSAILKIHKLNAMTGNSSGTAGKNG